jgi:hypothetical protein
MQWSDWSSDVCSSDLLGAAFTEGPEEISGLREALPPPPETAFRAAALANMSYRRRYSGEGASFFEWNIGEVRWLPAAGTNRTKRSGL